MGEDTQKLKCSTDVKLSLVKKIEYAVGDLGYNLIYFWVSSYLMIFYTDVFGVSMAAITTLMMIVRIFDAVNDPIIGSMADRTKQRTGVYKPWIKWGSLVLGISTVLLFWSHADWPYGLKLVYIYVTYIIVVCASTATNMPYGVLNGTITTDVQERTKISTIRFVCVFLGNMGVVAIASPLLNMFGLNSGKPGRAYILAVGLFCLISVPLLWIAAYKSKEVVKVPETQEKVALKDRFRALKCRPIIIIIIVFLFHGFVYYGRAAIYPYYFTYLCGKPAMLVQFGVIVGIANICGTLISPYVHKWLKHKGRATILEVLVFGLSTIAVYWFPPTENIMMFYIMTFIGGVGLGAYIVMLYSMAPDAIDDSHHKSGVSASGFLYACTSFMCKVGGALAPAVLSVILAATGYVPNIAQNTGVLNAINGMMSLLPGGVALIYAIVMIFYNISDDYYHKINYALQEKREGTSKNE